MVHHASTSLALAAIVGAAPSLFLLVFFYLKDRYEPEPRGHVALAFAKGALATLPAYAASWTLARVVGDEFLVLGGLPARAFDAVVLAAACEELPKWIALLFIYRWNELDEPLDGVVYGVALALGFATVENVLCVVRDGLGVGLLRAVFAVPAHALFGAVMGFYFGRAKFGAPSQARALLFVALVAAMALHGAYDFVLQALRGWLMYAAVAAGSVALWLFVLRRVHHAQNASPFKP
ncbi:MAG: PrsW family intramembrane metalloprotease [Myxococcales bacterium]|nr:PrsW family intramembrane metalloprotease [Myxococcales bacterium]